jgi:hypothetical protein
MGLCGMLATLLATPLSAEDKVAKFSTAYRMDNLNWNIAGNLAGTSPNVLSELEWRDLRLATVQLELSGYREDYYYRGSLGLGTAFGGENQDSDYAGDNRTLEFSRTVNGVSGSNTLDITGGVGREYPFGEQQQHQFIPLLGASYHAQYLRITDGNQVVSDLANAKIYDPSISSVPALGPFPGLDSSYDAQWASVWLGADVNFDLQQSGLFYTRGALHLAQYLAQANWNLRTDLAHPVSFEHDAVGSGVVLEVGWQKTTVGKGWNWGMGLSWQQWQTRPGNARTFSVKAGAPCFGNCYSDTRLNEVNWTSTEINFNLSKQF